MAIEFATSDPYSLLAAFKKAIDDRHIVTWSYDSDGDFTHTPDQWRYRGWLRPHVGNGRLTLNFLGQKNEQTSKEVYAVFHGRFAEAMLAHFDVKFTSATTTAMPTVADSITLAA